MLKISKRWTVPAVLFLSMGIARAEEATSRPAKYYGPDDVTAYASVNLEQFMKSRTVEAFDPSGLKDIRTEIQGVLAALGASGVGDLSQVSITSMDTLVFGNDPERTVIVGRGTWTTAQANAVIDAVVKRRGGSPSRVIYKEHLVESITTNGGLAIEITDGGAKTTVKGKGEGKSREAFVSVLDSGPVVVGQSLSAVTRVLDALDADPAQGEARLAPAAPKVAGAFLTVWASDIPGQEDRSDLPGPVRSLRSLWLVASEDADSFIVRASATTDTAGEAARLGGMGNALLMLGRSATTEPALQSLLESIRLTTEGSTLKLDWSWPLSRLGELKAFAEEDGGRPHKAKFKVRIGDENDADDAPATRSAK